MEGLPRGNPLYPDTGRLAKQKDRTHITTLAHARGTER